MIGTIITEGTGDVGHIAEDGVSASARKGHPAGTAVDEISESDGIVGGSSCWTVVGGWRCGSDLIGMGAIGDRIVPALFQRIGFKVGHDPNEPGRFVSTTRSRRRVARSGLIASRWVAFEGSVEVIGCQLDLVQVVFAAHRPGRFAGSLDRWQEQSDEDSDNGDHDQEFDEGKAQARVGSGKAVRWIGN